MSLPFPLLITQLCKLVRVSFVEAAGVRITSASSNNIQRMMVDYLRDDPARKKPPPADTNLIVDQTTLAPDILLPTPTVEPSGITSPSVFTFVVLFFS
ncbi:hypothetical protein H5410_045544 [Solanum commersonii]|uniref:Uncharacterized protein n=1 Tax=Solanum commersonii TaxID=4109 RepID=A0A9J5XD13_SOLCO|nr:hypothetical protein H5410_045544 [Solanum commersonii]